LCGDSQKKKSKARGSFYVKNGSLNYGCFNCGDGMSFGSFLKLQDPNLYREYNLEIFKEKMSNQVQTVDLTPHIPETKKYIPNIFEDLKLVRNLHEKSQAYIFCTKRRLPIEDFDFYFADKFIEWTKGHTDKFKNWKGEDHSRVIIPWYNKEQKIVGYSARALDSSQEQKYYRIFVDEDEKVKFFGLDRLNDKEQVYVLEGEIDSLMIPNAVAVANGKLQTYLNKDAIYIPDSDVRNKHIMKNVSDMIEAGLKVCMMPADLPGKDLNELVQAGWTTDELFDMIKSNTYQGLKAKLYFTKWKEC